MEEFGGLQSMGRKELDTTERLHIHKGTKDHIANIPWIIEKESPRKTSTSASLTMVKHLCGSQETVETS